MNPNAVLQANKLLKIKHAQNDTDAEVGISLHVYCTKPPSPPLSSVRWLAGFFPAVLDPVHSVAERAKQDALLTAIPP